MFRNVQTPYWLHSLGHNVRLVEVIVVPFKVWLFRKLVAVFLGRSISMATFDINVISRFMKFPDGLLLDVQVDILIPPELL